MSIRSALGILATLFLFGTAQASAATATRILPTDDVYLPTSEVLPPGVVPDLIHDLDTVRATWWGDMPESLVQRVLGDSPAQRVVFRDTLTGAEVWLICRSPGDEFEGFYSALGNFNADGSMLEIDRFVMTVLGANPRPLSQLVDRNRDRTAVRNFNWDAKDPATGLCQRFSGAIHRFNFRSGEEAPLFDPGRRFPRDCMLLMTDDGRHMLVARQKNEAHPFLYLTDAAGEILREIELKSRSSDPALDYMGGLQLYRDQAGEYFFAYSLNKAAARTTNPHQQWLAALDGSIYVDREKVAGSLSEGYLINGKRHVLTPAAADPMTSALGHAGSSPSGRYLVDSDGIHINLTDLQTRERRRLARVPSSDHFDWAAPVDWFLHRTRRQPGLPIYRVDVPSGVVHRIVASNTSDHLSCFSYSHASPDGTKCLYRSSMLGNLDMYLAVVRHPSPPRDVKLTRDGARTRLHWKTPALGREIRGYRVYRSVRSGGPYRPVGAGLIDGEEFVDTHPPARAWYVLTSVEHSGLESRRFSTEVAADWDAGPINRYFEAENGQLTFPMREVFVPADASAAYAITRAARDPLWEPASGEATAAWRIHLPRPGDYTLWARVRSRTGTPELIFTINDGPQARATNNIAPDWGWIRVTSGRRLSAGEQRLTLALPRPGCEVDKLLLSSDGAFSPVAQGDHPKVAPATPASLTADWDGSGRHVVLHWQAPQDPLRQRFDVYKSTMPDFQPGQRSLLGSPIDGAFIDPHPPETGEIYYRVCAVDTWGNRSEPSPAVGVQRLSTNEPVRARIQLGPDHVKGRLPIRDAADTAGGRCVILDGKRNPGTIEIPLNVPPGRYLLWLRAKSQGRYQIARLQIEDSKRSEKCLVTGVADRLFSEYIRSWRRVYSLDGSVVPRRTPLWITLTGQHPRLTIRPLDGYVELDELMLTTSVHDLPAPEAVHFKPRDDYRFERRR